MGTTLGFGCHGLFHTGGRESATQDTNSAEQLAQPTNAGKRCGSASTARARPRCGSLLPTAPVRRAPVCRTICGEGAVAASHGDVGAMVLATKTRASHRCRCRGMGTGRSVGAACHFQSGPNPGTGRSALELPCSPVTVRVRPDTRYRRYELLRGHVVAPPWYPPSRGCDTSVTAGAVSSSR